MNEGLTAGMKEGRKGGINEGRKEIRKEVVRLPENSASSRTPA